MDIIYCHKVNKEEPEGGDNIVKKISLTPYAYIQTLPGEDHPVYSGSVSINDKQYFKNASAATWAFYIGGYQPFALVCVPSNHFIK